uniref:Uncharacterized protein n=1 Tax=Megaselia scalaris TaxID=36166 RepID=T1GEM2_MEGSC
MKVTFERWNSGCYFKLLSYGSSDSTNSSFVFRVNEIGSLCGLLKDLEMIRLFEIEFAKHLLDYFGFQIA